MADCASYTTITYEAYDEASNTWVLAETQKWYFLESGIGLTVYVYPTDIEDTPPSVKVRVTYSSAYTASVSSTYILIFTGTCNGKPSLFDPSVLVDQEYTLTGTSVDYTFDAFTVVPNFCEITYTYSFAEATGEPVVSVFDSDTRTFTFEYTPDLDPLVDRLALS